jgi:hypothetical protein
MNKKHVFCLAILMSVLQSCGGSASPSTKYEGPFGLIDALRSGGLECTNFRETQNDERELGTEGAITVGDCDVDNETIEIVIWKDAGQIRNWEGLGKSLGCSFAKAFGVSEYDYVVGGNWTISNASQTLSDQLASASGGTAKHIKC